MANVVVRPPPQSCGPLRYPAVLCCAVARLSFLTRSGFHANVKPHRMMVLLESNVQRPTTQAS